MLHQVSILYTAPTAIRSLMAKGDEPVKKYKRSSLRILGTVGEPINPEAWRWYHEVCVPCLTRACLDVLLWPLSPVLGCLPKDLSARIADIAGLQDEAATSR